MPAGALPLPLLLPRLPLLLPRLPLHCPAILLCCRPTLRCRLSCCPHVPLPDDWCICPWLEQPTNRFVCQSYTHTILVWLCILECVPFDNTERKPLLTLFHLCVFVATPNPTHCLSLPTFVCSCTSHTSCPCLNAVHTTLRLVAVLLLLCGVGALPACCLCCLCLLPRALAAAAVACLVKHRLPWSAPAAGGYQCAGQSAGWLWRE